MFNVNLTVDKIENHMPPRHHLRFFNLILFLSLAASCATRLEETTQAEVQKQLMIAQLALKRGQNEQAYQTIDQLTRNKLPSTVFNHLFTLLKGEQHDQIRILILRRWTNAYPKELTAHFHLARWAVCNNAQNLIQTLIDYIELGVRYNKNSNYQKLTDCATPNERLRISTLLLPKVSPSAELNYFHVNNLMALNQNEAALNFLTKPNLRHNIDTRNQVVELLLKQQENEAALTELLQIIELHPHHIDSLYLVAEIYYDRGDCTRSKTYVDQVLILEPIHRRAQYLQAGCHFIEGALESSAAIFNQLLRVRSLRDSALYYLGEIARQQGKTEAAINYYQQIQDESYLLPAQLELWRLIAQTNLEQALQGIQTLMLRRPKNYLQIKLLQIELMKTYEDSMGALQELVILADDLPTNLRLQLLRMQWLIDAGLFEHLAANLAVSLNHLESEGERRELIESTGYYLLQQGLGDECIDFLNHQALMNSSDFGFRYLQGLCLSSAEQHEQAIMVLEQLLNDRPENHVYKNALAYTLILANKEFDRAAQLLKEALEADPDNAAYLDSLGWLYYLQQKFDLSLSYLTQADAQRLSVDIKAHLIQLYRAMGKEAKAEALLQEATGLFPHNQVLSNLKQPIAKPSQ